MVPVVALLLQNNLPKHTRPAASIVCPRCPRGGDLPVVHFGTIGQIKAYGKGVVCSGHVCSAWAPLASRHRVLHVEQYLVSTVFASGQLSSSNITFH